MAMTEKHKAALSAMRRYEEAVRAHEMRGAARPGERIAIEREYAKARDAMLDVLEDVQ